MNEEKTAAAGSVKKAMPKRKKKVMLNPAWFVNTVTLALKYKSTLVFTGNMVWGVCESRGENVVAVFKSNKEWCDEIARQFPTGAIFGGDTIHPTGEIHNKMKSYSKVAIDEKSKSYINELNGVLHVKGAGVVLKNGAFFESDSPIPKLPRAKAIPFAYEDHVDNKTHTLILASLYKDDTRRGLQRCFTQKLNSELLLIATNARTMVAVKVDGMPPSFSYHPNNVNITEVSGFVSVVDAAKTTTNVYQMNDGITLYEIPANGSMVFPRVDGVLGPADTCDYDGVVNGDSLSKVCTTVSKMGLGNGAMTRNLVFNKGTISLVTEDGTLAVFDAKVDIGDDDTATYDYDILAPFAKTKKDISIHSFNPGYCKNDTMIFVAIPMRMTPPPLSTEDEK